MLKYRTTSSFGLQQFALGHPGRGALTCTTMYAACFTCMTVWHGSISLKKHVSCTPFLLQNTPEPHGCVINTCSLLQWACTCTAMLHLASSSPSALGHLKATHLQSLRTSASAKFPLIKGLVWNATVPLLKKQCSHAAERHRHTSSPIQAFELKTSSLSFCSACCSSC